MISIIIPTIDGREGWLLKCLRSYDRHTRQDFEPIVVRNAPTWGIGIQQGMERGPRGRYLHFTADDIEPHPGWDVAAREAVDQGYLPAPRILNSDDSLQSCGGGVTETDDWQPTEFTRVPFMSADQWAKIGPMIPLHYYTDNWVSHRGRLAGIQTVVRRDYLFTHHWAPEGRLDERFEADGTRYRELIAQ